MPLPVADYQRTAIHECGHVFAGIRADIDIYGVTLQGRNSIPGAVWRVDPDDENAETSKPLAGKLVDLFMGGSLAERVFYNDRRKEWIDGPTGDRAMVDYLTFQHLNNEAEATLVIAEYQQNPNLTYDQYRQVFPNMRWNVFDAHIQARRAAITADMNAHKGEIELLAKKLLADGYVSGREIYSILGRPWNGSVRTTPWDNLP